MQRRRIAAENPRAALLAERYRTVREETVGLAKRLTIEDQVVQPYDEASLRSGI